MLANQLVFREKSVFSATKQTIFRLFTLYAVSLLLTVFSAASLTAQTINFDETWKEFLENNKISNMSALVKPNKQYRLPDYAKYLLMNTNTNFCQSKVPQAITLMEEIHTIDAAILGSIEGFVPKMDDLDVKIVAYKEVDVLWNDFLRTKTVNIQELESIESAGSLCEKQTLAKYSYMMAYHNLCAGEVATSMEIFENRTLRLAERTTLRVRDVEGLAEEVASMKTFYQELTKLEAAWRTYVNTGVSPGYTGEVPYFACYPIPKMKELMLKGVLDVCNNGAATIEEIKRLQTESGVVPDRELQQQIKVLEAAIAEKNSDLAALNEAWEAFIPDNKVKHMGRYGYEYCEKEPLIKAYVMDGFAYVCEMAGDMLRKIDSLQRDDITPLSQITMTKINELAALHEDYRVNGVEIEGLWSKFVAQGDTLYNDYISADFYCDNIHQVKDWTMKGLSASCEVAPQYLEQIEYFQATFEFNFTTDLECRVQKLRIKIWECRWAALHKLAKIEAPDAVDQRLSELMEEYGMSERPEVCAYER